MKHDFESKEDWYVALVEIAKSHDNKSAVRDFDGWTDNWKNETPEESYYSEFPEHKSAMEQFLSDLKSAGIQIENEPMARSHIELAENIQLAVLELSRQGRSIGVTFSSNPMKLNAPAVVEALKEAGFNDVQVGEFFANTSIQYSAKEVQNPNPL